MDDVALAHNRDDGLVLDLERLHAHCHHLKCTLKLQSCHRIVQSEYDQIEPTDDPRALLLRLGYVDAPSKSLKPLFTWV